jgi:ABC-type multidrug transport system fused ATPase/permease subunit
VGLPARAPACPWACLPACVPACLCACLPACLPLDPLSTLRIVFYQQQCRVIIHPSWLLPHIFFFSSCCSELRSDMFESLMRREIAFFDDENHAVGTLTTQLADDARTVHKATGTYHTTAHNIPHALAFELRWSTRSSFPSSHLPSRTHSSFLPLSIFLSSFLSSFLPFFLPSFLIDLGETFANQLQALFTLAIGLIIGFTASWKISLVVIATFPINVCI